MSKNKGVMAIFPEFSFHFELGKINVTPSFFFKMTLNFLCEMLEQKRKKNHKIAIVKFFLYIVRNCSQSPANFHFSKFKVQSLDIATLLGAEGPQQGPQGPKGPEGPPALRRS